MYIERYIQISSTHCQWEKQYTPSNLEIDSVRENVYSTAWLIYSAIPAMLKSSYDNLCVRLAPCATTFFAHMRKTPKLLSC